jgi:hypothetical protein
MDKGVWLINILATSSTLFPAKAVLAPIEKEAGCN